MELTIKPCILTQNDCYRKGRYIRPRGVMVHSTGAANPYLRRYLSPDDGRLGEPSSRHWNQGGVGACVHAMIGKTADGSVAVYQTRPGPCVAGTAGGLETTPTSPLRSVRTA